MVVVLFFRISMFLRVCLCVILISWGWMLTTAVSNVVFVKGLPIQQLSLQIYTFTHDIAAGGVLMI